MSEVESSSPPEDGAAADSPSPPPEPEAQAPPEEPQANGAQPESEPEPVADEPVAEEPAPAPDADEPPAEPVAEQSPSGVPEVPGTPDDDRPLIGPKIIGMAPPDPPPQPVKRLARPRRRRPTAADKHRRLFFQKLNEMRREGRPPEDEVAPAEAEPAAVAEEPVAEEAVAAPEAEAPVEETPAAEAQESAGEEPAAEEPAGEEPAGEEPAAEEPAAEEPAAEEPAADEPAVEGPAAERPPARPARREAPPLDAKAKARLSVAIERVGGAEVIQAALVPKQDDEGAPKRWALVCCEAAMGTPPGDPVYVAWLRLASTPVREVKSALRGLVPERETGRGRGRGRGDRGGGERGARPPRDRGDQPRGEGRGAPRGDRDRKPREDRGERLPPGAGIDGAFTPKVRIVTNDADERAERDRLRKEEREAKRRAAQERLDRLGF